MMNRMYTTVLTAVLLAQGSIVFSQDETVEANNVKRTLATAVVLIEQLEDRELEKDENLDGQNGEEAQQAAIAIVEEEAAVEAEILEVAQAITTDIANK